MARRSALFVLLLSTLVKMAISQQTSCGPSITATINIGNVSPSNVTGRLGLPLGLTCNIDPNSAVADSYTWLHNDQIDTIDTSNILQLMLLTSGDGGLYRCRAVIRISQNITCQTEYSSTLTVNTPPTITSISSAINIVARQSLQISCEAEGYPAPTYEWYKTSNEQEILSEQAIYSVLAANVSHSGLYVCNATNSAGSSNRNVNVTVRSPPPPMITPEIPQQDTTTLSPTTQGATSNYTQGTTPTVSSIGFYIGVAVISAVVVIFTLLTGLCFTVWVCYSVTGEKTVNENESGFADEEMEEEFQEAVDIEKAAFEEMIDPQVHEIIPQPVKKKTRGKRPKL